MPNTNRDGFENEKNNIKYSGYFYDGETGLYLFSPLIGLEKKCEYVSINNRNRG